MRSSWQRVLVIAGYFDRWNSEVINKEFSKVAFRDLQVIGKIGYGMLVQVAVVNAFQGCIDYSGPADVAGIVIHIHVRPTAKTRAISFFKSSENRFKVFDIFLLWPLAKDRRGGRRLP